MKKADERRKQATIKNGIKQPGLDLSEVGFNVANGPAIPAHDRGHLRPLYAGRQASAQSAHPAPQARPWIAKIPQTALLRGGGRHGDIGLRRTFLP